MFLEELPLASPVRDAGCGDDDEEEQDEQHADERLQSHSEEARARHDCLQVVAEAVEQDECYCVAPTETYLVLVFATRAALACDCRIVLQYRSA